MLSSKESLSLTDAGAGLKATIVPSALSPEGLANPPMGGCQQGISRSHNRVTPSWCQRGHHGLPKSAGKLLFGEVSRRWGGHRGAMPHLRNAASLVLGLEILGSEKSASSVTYRNYFTVIGDYRVHVQKVFKSPKCQVADMVLQFSAGSFVKAVCICAALPVDAAKREKPFHQHGRHRSLLESDASVMAEHFLLSEAIDQQRRGAFFQTYSRSRAAFQNASGNHRWFHLVRTAPPHYCVSSFEATY
jgi:hypothetical protein